MKAFTVTQAAGALQARAHTFRPAAGRSCSYGREGGRDPGQEKPNEIGQRSLGGWKNPRMWRKKPWWQDLKSEGGQALPATAPDRLSRYNRGVRHARTGFYTLEILSLGVAAAIPAATTVG